MYLKMWILATIERLVWNCLKLHTSMFTFYWMQLGTPDLFLNEMKICKSFPFSLLIFLPNKYLPNTMYIEYNKHYFCTYIISLISGSQKVLPFSIYNVTFWRVGENVSEIKVKIKNYRPNSGRGKTSGSCEIVFRQRLGWMPSTYNGMRHGRERDCMCMLKSLCLWNRECVCIEREGER